MAQSLDLVTGNPACGRGVKLDDLWGPFQLKTFYDTMVCICVCQLFSVFCFLFFPWTIKYNKISWINVISYCGIVIRDGGENLSTGYANTIFGGVRGTLRDWQSLIHLSSVLCPLFTRDFSTDVGVKAWELFRSITKVLKCTKWGKNENGLMDLLT